MDLSKLSMSDKIIGGSAAVLFIASFLPWFTADGFGRGSFSANGWDVGFFWAGIPVLLGLAMAAQVGLSNFSPETKLPELPVSWGQAHFGAGAVAGAIVVLKLLVGESVLGFSLSRGFGLFLAAVAAAGLAYGGFQKFQEDKQGAGTL